MLYPDLTALQPQARYAFLPCVLDPSFDAISDRFAWMKAVSDKHRDNYFARLHEQDDF